MSAGLPEPTSLEALRAAGAPRFDAVGWHYLEILAERSRMQSGAAQALLQHKLQAALKNLQLRMSAAAAEPVPPIPANRVPSPLAVLLEDMKPKTGATGAQNPGQLGAWRAQSPRVQQFRKQLSRISVQKQVTQAMAQAPQNAGPINSHMLVLRSLGMMRDISPDYLNRFMAHVDTLLCLDEAEKGKLPARKVASKLPPKSTGSVSGPAA